MKARLVQSSKNYKYLKIIMGLILVIFFSVGCTKESVQNKVIVNQKKGSAYFDVIEKIMPTYNLKDSNNQIFYNLEQKAVTEAFDVQADGALKTGVAKFWYPHYQSTVVIAINRNLTNVSVSGWKDLTSIDEVVGISRKSDNMQMIMAAISYGLEGENYSLDKSVKLLSELKDNNRLIMDSFDSAVTIGFDSEIQATENIEIVVPIEGTITYMKGLLANQSIIFSRKLNQDLLDHNLKIQDSDLYMNATRVSDFEHFNKATRKTQSLVEREILEKNTFMTVDNQEHLFIAVIFIIITTIWVITIVRRSIHKGIFHSAILTGILVNSWTLLRMIKYQTEAISNLNRYLWYAFYIFQLLLPVVFLWMAYSIDKTEKRLHLPKWFITILLLSLSLICFVFSNDLHNLVFNLDLSKSDWNINYTYGWGYYLVLIFSMLNLFFVFFILLFKSIKNPKKITFIFPTILFIIFIIYNYKYISRNPFIYETDITVITGIFVLLMFEVCIRSGLIPVNTKYFGLFKRSPLKMQITDELGQVIVSSTLANPVDEEVFEALITHLPTPYFLDEEFLLFANKISGGYAIWNEDVKEVYQLHKEIKATNKLLKEANSMLTREKELQRHVNEKKAKQEVMEQLEQEISKSINLLTKKIEKLPESKNQVQSITQIALLLSYIKRRSNLFFKEKESSFISSDELVVYIDELAEIAKYADLKIATINLENKQIAIRQATLIYDIFYEIVDLALSFENTHIIEQIYLKEDNLTVKLLLSDDFKNYKLEESLNLEIIKLKGKVLYKDLDDSIGISISFPKGGVGDD